MRPVRSRRRNTTRLATSLCPDSHHMDSFSSRHYTIHGGTGGAGGQGGVLGGAGGHAEGPRFENVTVHGNVINHFPLPGNPGPQDHRNQSLGPVMMKDHKPCPLPVSSFTGQRDILQKMHNYFDRDQGSVQHIFVLHGLGGSGKSQLAFKFVHDSQAQAIHRFSKIFYIDATNEQTMKSDLQTITPMEVGNSAEASLRWLAGKQEEWLLLFDNADDTKLNLSKFFPHCTFGNILITTRNQDLCLHTRDEGAVSRVSNMGTEDAKVLLLQLARQNSNGEQNKQAVAIVKELHCFPLAVSQAEIQGSDCYGLAVYATWNLSYDKLSTAARTLLQICSRLHHEGITEEIFEKAATSQQELDGPDLPKEVTQLLTELGKQDGDWDSMVFHEVIGELKSYSLIEHDREADSYTIHPLVQHWSGMMMGTNKHLMQKCVLTIIALSISRGHKYEDHKYRRKLLPHAVRSRNLFDLEEISTFIAAQLGWVYWQGGFWNDTEALDMVVMEKTKHELGEEHPDTLKSMGNLADTYRNLGRWNEAEALEVVVMEKSKQVLGEDHPDTLSRMANLAATYWNLGRWNDAEVLEEVVMEKSKCLLGDEHPDTLRSMGNLAATYRDLGRWNDAEVLEMVVMKKRKVVLGEEHPDTLRSMSNLALTYGKMGRWTDAQVLQVVVMEKSKCLLGDEHPDTLRSMGNLAVTYGTLACWNEAEALEVVVMEKSKQVLGEEHPDTLLRIANLAATYWNLGRWDDAEALKVVLREKSKNQ
ncbi:P-loop containing nucleoside triphosphate hydrolase protein [Mycena galericulata]|nr:P-loop containing nucleoside triphosphate hydrolase protein [Mycena galericulata]